MANSSTHHEAEIDAVLALLSGQQFSDVTTENFDAHQVLFEPEQPADQVFYLLSGAVRVTQSLNGGTQRLVAIQGRGSWIGLAPLARQSKYGFRATAHSPAKVLIVPAPVFFKLIDTSDKVAAGIVSQLATRLLQSCTVATRISSQDCSTRIVETLLDLGNSAAAVADDDEVILQISHQDLAQAVGVARETVSAALTTLRRDDLVRTGRNRMSFNRKTLRQFAESRDRQSKGVQPQ